MSHHNAKHKLEMTTIIKWFHTSQFQITILKPLDRFFNTLGNTLLQWSRRIYEQICWTSERQKPHMPPSSFISITGVLWSTKEVKVGTEYPEIVSLEAWILGLPGWAAPWTKSGACLQAWPGAEDWLWRSLDFWVQRPRLEGKWRDLA